MTQSIDPIRPVNGDRRARARRATDAPAPAAPPVQLPVVVEPDTAPDPLPVLSAHLIGQENQRRGLRGGPETLAKAQAAYLTAEWSGVIDRRTRRGVISKTKI